MIYQLYLSIWGEPHAKVRHLGTREFQNRPATGERLTIDGRSYVIQAVVGLHLPVPRMLNVEEPELAVYVVEKR